MESGHGSSVAHHFHHFTVDVEEYFHAGAVASHLERLDWRKMESRVEQSVDGLLELLEETGARGTFFVLGWIARYHPGMVRRISDAGHEIASHGWGHRRISKLDQETFRLSVRRTKALLEHVTGEAVTGYRAPNFSVVPGCEWALDVLLEEGYRYDSSVFPIRRPGYGYPSADRVPHQVPRESGIIREFPPATLRFLGKNIPVGGGAYFRFFPYSLFRKAFASAEREGIPATFYIHPWEMDEDQPRMPLPLLSRLRHYAGVDRVRSRLSRLLSEFRFRSIRESLSREYLPTADPVSGVTAKPVRAAPAAVAR